MATAEAATRAQARARRGRLDVRAASREVMLPVLLAIVADLLLTLLLQPPRGDFPLAGRLLAFALRAVFAVSLGVWLGKRTWPRRGKRLSLRLLRRTVNARRRTPLVVLTDRPDFRLPLARRVVEVLGFAAGVPVLVVALLSVAGFDPDLVAGFTTLFALAALWGSFVVVPYWLFARMGLRRVDPVRWVVEPLSRRIGGRLRLSNGALLLVAAGAIANLAFRAGESLDRALVLGVVRVGQVVAFVLVAAATATAFYLRAERGLARGLEEEAVRLGVRDGRGMSDGDFLPRVPPAGGEVDGRQRKRWGG